MSIRWFQILKATPDIKSAADTVATTKNWTNSASIWYQLIKVAVTVLTALGVTFALSAEDIQTISVSLAVAIPAVCTLADAIAAIWLRLRTGQAIDGTKTAMKQQEATSAQQAKLDGSEG